MASEHGYVEAGDWRGKMRASDADRDRVVERLGTAYSEGRLFRDEYDERLERALAARTYGELDQLMIDLPAAAPVVPQAVQINRLALASVACALGQVVFGPMLAIPAIILGYAARSQIKRTGEQGAGLALTGVILGWVVIVGVVLLGVLLTLSGGFHGAAGG